MQKISIKGSKKSLIVKSAIQNIVIDAKEQSFKVISQEKSLNVNSRVQKFFIRNKNKQKLVIDTAKRAINIQTSGKRGLPGPAGQDGKDGLGVPSGGLAGQVLVKLTDNDNDTTWGSISGADKYYIENFVFKDQITVAHNLLKYPAVTVHDSAGDEVEGEIEHLDINTIKLQFTAPFSGRVTCS